MLSSSVGLGVLLLWLRYGHGFLHLSEAEGLSLAGQNVGLLKDILDILQVLVGLLLKHAKNPIVVLHGVSSIRIGFRNLELLNDLVKLIESELALLQFCLSVLLPEDTEGSLELL